MSATLLATWIGLMIPLAQSEESIIPAGNIPVGLVLQGWSVLTDQQVLTQRPDLGHRSVQILRPLRLSAPSMEPVLRGLLRSEGIELKPIRRGLVHGPHWATTDPSEMPPLERYQVRVIRLQHLDPEPICRLLENAASTRESDLGPLDRRSRFVADPRIGAVIISCTSSVRLDHYLKLLSAADRPAVAGTQRPVLKSWKTRYGRASELATSLEASWEERGGQPIHVVVHTASNSLMIRVPKQLWPAVERLLDQLDRPDDL